MFCSKCGTELNEGTEFCSKCGTKAGLSTEGQNTINQQNDNRPATTQVVVMPTGTGPLVMGLLGLFGGFIPIVQYITGLLSLLAIFVGASQRKKLKNAGLPTGKATAGIVLGTIAVLITVIAIALSAMVLGALFSGGGSSSRSSSRSTSIPTDSVKRINFFTNNLPDEIQGTVWSRGRDNVEFGKNKVKFNDNWYSVKKITQGTSPGNRMFTRVYFGNNDNYVVLQRLSNNELILPGYKTPAEIEAERIENERIAEEKRLAEIDAMVDLSYTEDDLENAIPFNFANMFYTYFGKTKTYPSGSQIIRYIEVVYSDELSKKDITYTWRGDEFEVNRLVKQANDDIREGIAKFDKNAIYNYRSLSQFGEYDFSRDGFYVEVDEYLKWSSEPWGTIGIKSYVLAFPAVMRHEGRYFYKMDADEAEAYTKSNGKSVGLILYFKIDNNDKQFLSFKEKILRSNPYLGDIFMNGHLLKVEVWDTKKRVKMSDLML